MTLGIIAVLVLLGLIFAFSLARACTRSRILGEQLGRESGPITVPPATPPATK